MKMEFTIQKILEFHDLFPKEKDLDVRTILKNLKSATYRV